MAKTKDDLIYRALKCLGVLPQGNTPNEEEYNQVNDLIDGVVDDLRLRDIYFLPDVDAIPEAAFRYLGQCVAWAAAPDFGQENNANLYELCQQSELKLQTQQAEGPYYTPLEVQAY